MTERRKRILQACILVFVIGVILVMAKFAPGLFYQKNEADNYYTVVYTDVFDTVTYITGYGETEDAFKAQAEMLHEKLQEYHQYYDIYNEYSEVTNLKTINEMAGKGPVEVEAPIMELLIKSVEIYQQTEGKVNIAMGSVLEIWHNYREKGLEVPESASLPSMELLMEQGKYTDISQLLLDEENMTVSLEHKEMSLDVGSVAKGYAADLIGEYAKEIGMEHVLISIGGNIVAVGGKEDGSSWNIGIQDPIATKKGEGDFYVEAVAIKEGCVVTSGDYQRYYTVDGVDYCHIINPENWMPADNYASVTIIGEDSLIADALSTALFCMDLEEGKSLLEKMPGYEAMWIYSNGEKEMTSGFMEYVKD